MLLRLTSTVIAIPNCYPHKRACQGHLILVSHHWRNVPGISQKLEYTGYHHLQQLPFQALYTVLAQVTQCDFRQRLLHSASGSIKHFEEDINDTVLIEAITIVLVWIHSTILNLLNPMSGQMWNQRILQTQLLFFQSCTYISPGFHISVRKTIPCTVTFFAHQDGKTRTLQY